MYYFMDSFFGTSYQSSTDIVTIWSHEAFCDHKRQQLLLWWWTVRWLFYMVSSRTLREALISCQDAYFSAGASCLNTELCWNLGFSISYIIFVFGTYTFLSPLICFITYFFFLCVFFLFIWFSNSVFCFFAILCRCECQGSFTSV